MRVDENYQIENPAQTSGRFGSFVGPDRYVLAVVLAVTALIWSLTSLLVAVVCGLVLMLPLYRAELGRLYRLAIRRYNGWMIRRRNHVLWQAASKAGRRFTSSIRGWKNPLQSVGLGTLGILHYARGKSDTIVIVGDGSTMAAKDMDGQVQSHLLYADAIKRAASIRKFAVGWSSIFQRRPANLLAYRNNEDNSVHPEVALPEAIFKEESELTEYDRTMLALLQIDEEDAELFAEMASSVTMAVSLTVRHDSALSSALKTQRMLGRKVPRLVLSKIADNAVKGLKRFGASNLRVLDDYGIEDFIREGWDVEGIHDYREEAAQRRAEKANGTKVSDEAIYWPGEHILVYDDYLVMDGTYLTTIRMTTGKRYLTIGEMRQLYAVDIPWVTITEVGEAVNSQGEYRRFNFVRNLWVDTQDATGFWLGRGVKAERRDEARQQRLTDLDSSGFSLSYNIVAIVLATNTDDLEDWAAKMESHADYLGLGPERVVGEDFQLPYALSGLTGVNML